jgi:uncharacterized membrane protein YqjE
LFARLRRLLGTSLELLQLRIELLATDVELGTLRFFDAVVLALAALLALAVGLGLLCAWILLMLQPEYRLTALGLMALAFLAGGAWAVVAARGRMRQSGRAFQATRAELARDLAALSPDRASGP